MSEQKGYNIRCPQCGRDQDVQLYESINVQAAPELKQKLLANELNAVTCEKCKLTFRVDKPLLYNDPERRLMIYLVPLKEEDYEEGERQFADSLHRLNNILPQGVPAPDVTLVFDRNELVERIFLVDAGLNPRIIEYIKHLLYVRNLSKVTRPGKPCCSTRRTRRPTSCASSSRTWRRESSRACWSMTGRPTRPSARCSIATSRRRPCWSCSRDRTSARGR